MLTNLLFHGLFDTDIAINTSYGFTLLVGSSPDRSTFNYILNNNKKYNTNKNDNNYTNDLIILVLNY